MGERIRAAREAAGLSVTAAAARIGVKQQQWSKWENEGVIPSDKHRPCIADALDIDQGEFLGWVTDAYEQRDADKTRQLAKAHRDIDALTTTLEQLMDELRSAIAEMTAKRGSR